MTPLNYNHLCYFFHVATDGSITRASARLNLTPQTISGQIAAFEEQLGSEIRQMRQTNSGATETFRVGITEVIPKILANRLLQPILRRPGEMRLVCHEGDQETLLAELAASCRDSFPDSLSG